jgi:hypothetical protein
VTVNGLFVTELTHGGMETTLSDFKWQTFDVQFLASSTTSDLRLEDVTNLDPYRGALLDALSITPIPEPSSLALLGSPGVVLPRRRSRHRESNT